MFHFIVVFILLGPYKQNLVYYVLVFNLLVWSYTTSIILCVISAPNLVLFSYFFRYLLCVKNISMLNMLTFDVFSVCHSHGQSVTGIALFMFWHIPQEYSFSQIKFFKYRIFPCFLKYLFYSFLPWVPSLLS